MTDKWVKVTRMGYTGGGASGREWGPIGTSNVREGELKAYEGTAKDAERKDFEQLAWATRMDEIVPGLPASAPSPSRTVARDESGVAYLTGKDCEPDPGSHISLQCDYRFLKKCKHHHYSGPEKSVLLLQLTIEKEIHRLGDTHFTSTLADQKLSIIAEFLDRNPATELDIPSELKRFPDELIDMLMDAAQKELAKKTKRG